MLKGTRTRSQPSPMERSSYRVPWIQPENAVAAFMHEARIIDINLNTWTVDVRTQFDRKYYLNIQVGSPYMNPVTGGGHLRDARGWFEVLRHDPLRRPAAGGDGLHHAGADNR